MAIEVRSAELECFYQIMKTFGCVRKDSMHKYLLQIKRYSKMNVKKLIEDTLKESQTFKLAIKNGEEYIYSVWDYEDIYHVNMDIPDAFEVYIALIKKYDYKEAQRNVRRGPHPYDFSVKLNKKTYHILLFDEDGTYKLLTHNRNMKAKLAKNETDKSKVDDDEILVIAHMPRGKEYDEQNFKKVNEIAKRDTIAGTFCFAGKKEKIYENIESWYSVGELLRINEFPLP